MAARDWHDDEQIRRAFLDAGGTVEGFSKSWPDLKRRYREERAQEKLTAADRMYERMTGGRMPRL